jgi:mRNA interferase MazF
MKQGEIWLINLDPTMGSEIKKTRPAIVVNDNSLGKLPLKVIVPLTDWKDRYDIAPWMVKILPDKFNNLSKPSAADCFQIRSLSELRFTKRLGKVTSGQLAEIRAGLAKVLSIKE